MFVPAHVPFSRMVAHPIHRRYYAEELVRLRRAGERLRQVASQRRSRVDPNPHQIDAVMFALRRIPEGGCILADEVGLGKTIEAGLVIAQLLAEGASRVLVVVPRPLLGQWQNELDDLFGIAAAEATDEKVDIAGPGVFLVGREYAGGSRGFERLTAGPPFDLCLIDEAHEVFAGIHRRFDSDGGYRDDSRHALTAHRVREVIGASPVLLLTATPIQNTLTELWALVQYVDRSGTLLGAKPVFEEVFCAGGDGRRVAAEQAQELKRRLGTVVQRTLRRQAQDFLDKPFVGRCARLFEYRMSPAERALYDDVTEYLLRPRLCAFQGRSRQLLLLGFHRRMASSTAALAASLDRVADRLRSMLGGEQDADAVASFADDLEDDPADVGASADHTDADAAVGGGGGAAAPEAAAVRDELALVEDFVRRANALPRDSKAQSLVTAVRLVMARSEDRRKVVIFTESLTTQDYLRDLLLAQTELDETDITLFRGVNDSPRAREAMRVWREEKEGGVPAHQRSSPSVAMRRALIHEFQTRSVVLISSEAGAKGLNMQFCDTVVNYDLPWNPQRIEQRIGRCHRYGQQRDVTVINFLAKDNEAQRLTLEILSTKLDLFGRVLDASDVVLQTPRSEASEDLASALGPDFETEVRRIWDRARSVGEVEDELRRLRDKLEGRRQELELVRGRTMGLIERSLDESVRDVFRGIQTDLPKTLAKLDAELERVLTAYLDAIDVAWGGTERGGRRVLHIGASRRLPALIAAGTTVALGSARDSAARSDGAARGGVADIGSLHLAHPLIEAAVAEARRAGAGAFRVRFHLGADAPEVLRRHRGVRGRLALTRIAYRGFEREDRLRSTAVFEDAEVLRPAAAALDLVRQRCEDVGVFDPPLAVTAEDLDEVVDEELFLDQCVAADHDRSGFESAMDQLDQHIADRMLVSRRARDRCAKRLAAAERQRDGALGADNRARAVARVGELETEIEGIDERIAQLAARDDDVYRRWKDNAHQRRFQRPETERLLTAEFVIA